MGDVLPKQYLPIRDVPMVFRTLDVLARVKRIEKIVVVISAGDTVWDALWAKHVESNPVTSSRFQVLRVGGKTRGESVANGLQALSSEMNTTDWALVHDAARPCIRAELIEQFLDELVDEPIGGLLALPVADTLKLASADQRVEKTVSREALWRAQTPQMFRYGLLCAALALKLNATDEAEAMEATGKSPKLVIGDSTNLKVTFAADLRLAEMILVTSALAVDQTMKVSPT